MSKFVSKKLSKDIGMYFLDTDELLKYNLQNEKDIKNICGEDYLQKLKSKVLGDVFDYENSLIYMPFSLFLEGSNAKKLRVHSHVVFLEIKKEDYKNLLRGNKKILSKEDKVNLTAYDLRNEFCKQNCDICVKLNSADFAEAFQQSLRKINDFLL
jgi:shikimate kinase